MTATRQHDETILSALDLMCSGMNLSRTAARLGKNPSNLAKALRKVLHEDLKLSGDDPYDVITAYPDTLSLMRENENHHHRKRQAARR